MAYKILVPLHSLDEHIPELVQITNNLARHPHGKLLLLNVLPDPEHIHREEARQMMTEARAMLNAFAEQLDCSSDAIEIRLMMGSPSQEIQKCIIIEQTDIVAMPTNVYSSINRLLLGSVAEDVIRHAHCPVITTRDSDTTNTFQRILVPFDGTEESAMIIQLVADFAALYGSEVTLFYDEFGSTEDQLVDEIEQQARERLARSQDALAGQGIRVKLHTTRFRNPAEEIIRIVDELDIDLVAMTTHGRSGFSRFLFGSVAEQFMHNSKCPLLTLSTTPVDNRPHDNDFTL